MLEKFKTNNLDERINQIDHYLNKTEKLEEIVEDPEVLGVIPSIIGILNDCKKFYKHKIKIEKQEMKHIIEENKLIARIADDSYNGDFEKAKESLKISPLQRKEIFFDFRKAAEYGFFCVITAPFSRKISASHSRCCTSYLGLLKKRISLLKEQKKLNKEKKEIKCKRYDSIIEKEFNEAKFADDLIKYGFKEDELYYISTQRPELYFFAVIESLAERHGKGIV